MKKSKNYVLTVKWTLKIVKYTFNLTKPNRQVGKFIQQLQC